MIELVRDADSSCPEFLNVLHALIQWEKPKIVVEAGTYKGHFARVVADACPEAKIWTADPHDYGFQGTTNIIALRGDFTTMLTDFIAPGTVDLAYIDSGPTSEMTTAEDVRWMHFAAVGRYMRKGGLIIVDDTQPSGFWTNVNMIRKVGVQIGDENRQVTLIRTW